MINYRRRAGRSSSFRFRFSDTKLFLLLCVLLLLSCGKSAGPGRAYTEFQCPAYSAGGLEVSCLSYHETTYVVLRVDLRAALVRVLWRNSGGVPYSSLDGAYSEMGDDVLALTNAGIYSASHTPEGLHVEGGVTLNPLNLNVGEGNFYWKPNGVFYVSEEGAGIVESEKFN